MSLRRAASLARSFLLLEDDYDVDWEVDGDERDREAALAAGSTRHHPHRRALRSRLSPPERRRGGQPPRPDMPCLCPIGAIEDRTGTHNDRSERPSRALAS